MKLLICTLTLIACCAARAQKPVIAQESDLLKRIDSFDLTAAEGKSTPAPTAASIAESGSSKPAAQKKGPTEITSTKEATFDNKTRQAVFTGNVHVKDPEFTISCEKLTAFLHDAAAAKPASPAPKATPAASPAKPSGNAGGTAGGLDRAVAEGKVTIIQDKPGENGGPPKRYIGKSERADYDAATGDVKLTGWPQIQQGINTQISTEASTVMILNRDGRMKTQGGSKTVIQEQTD